MSNFYSTTWNVGEVSHELTTDDADFMQWYLTKDDVEVEYDPSSNIKDGVHTRNMGLSIESAYEKISKAFEKGNITVAIEGDRSASITVA